MDESGWIYETLSNTFYVWGLVQGCDATSWAKVDTPFDNVHRNKNLACFEYTRGCKSGRAMQCMYDGEHGDIPHYMADMSWWFWNTRYNQSTPIHSGIQYFLQ